MITDVINSAVLTRLHNYRESFDDGDPFKHVLMTDFFSESFIEGILREFPVPDPDKLVNEFGNKSRKHAVHDIRDLGPTFKRWDEVVQSSEFIQAIQTITGIDELCYDPEYHGAGTHNNMDGQGMDVHIDFNLHRTTGYHRRLNLIIYLNEEWDESWHGNLELHKNPWDRKNDYFKSFPPYKNHAVLFETNEHSWHGFDNIVLPADKKNLSRKSLTVYFYTKERPQEEIAPKHSTIYVQKGIPAGIAVGEVMTKEKYAELENIFLRRDRYLQGMYSRESRLQVTIQNLKRQINRQGNTGLKTRIKRALKMT